MRSMEIDRRRFLGRLMTGLGATGLAGATAPGALAAGIDDDEPLFVAARREADGSHCVAVVGLDGLDRLVIPLPARGHDVSVCPATGRCLAFARRPGTFAVVFDPVGASPPVFFVAAAGRHFYGHGAFSPDGRLAYATENDYAARRGVIGVYDVSAETPRRIGEFDSGGIGPHDILPMPDGRSLVVANGGIATHPHSGREKLNLDDMRPNIALIDATTGARLGTVEGEPGLSRLSLRHMAVGADARVWIGGQYQGEADGHPPLMASLDPAEGRLRMHHIPDELRPGLENYIGSVTLNREASVVAASCPRGGRVLYFSADDGSFLASQRRDDACGLAPLDARSFLISDGGGALLESAAPDRAPLLAASRAGLAFDNHLVALTPSG